MFAVVHGCSAFCDEDVMFRAKVRKCGLLRPKKGTAKLENLETIALDSLFIPLKSRNFMFRLPYDESI